MTPIEVLLLDWQPGHSVLQMDSFITLRSGGTLYGCLFQSLRELATRHFAIREREFAREQLIVDIDELEATPATGFERRRSDIRLRQKREQLADVERAIAENRKELVRFHEQADAIRAAMRDEGIRFPLDGATKHRLDCEMWEHNLKSRCAVEYMANGRLGVSTIELIQACPRQMRSRIAATVLDAERHEQLLCWFMEQDQDSFECYGSFDSQTQSPRMSPTDAPVSQPTNCASDCSSASAASIATG